jgi:hypothetical protein
MSPVKTSNLIKVLAIVAWAAAGHAQAQSASPSHPPQRDPFVKTPGQGSTPPASGIVKVQSLMFTVEEYAMAQDDAAQVIELSGSGEARHDAVLALLHAGKARLETLMCCGNNSGGRSVVESVDEVRYGVAYGAGDQHPTSFGTRDVGDTMEYEDVVSENGKLCDINIVLQHVRLIGFDPVYAHPATSVVQARFQSDKFTTSVTLDVGRAEFLGTLSGPAKFEPAPGNTAAQEVRLAFGKVDRVDVGTDHAGSPGPATPPPASANMELTLVYYSMDRETAREILSTGFTGDACYNAVKELADKKQAKLERITVLNTKSGQRAVVFETEEVRYPTQYYQPFQPTDFETRNCGLTIEIEPTLDEPGGSVLDLKIVPDLASYEGDLQEGSNFAPQPLIEERKITTGLSALVGEHTLIGTASDPGDDGVNGRKDTGRTWLCFVQTTL